MTVTLPHEERERHGRFSFSGEPASLTGLLARRADETPDRLAMADGPRRAGDKHRPRRELTYRDALAAVQRFAAYLRGLGLPDAARVGLSLAHDVDAAVALLAVENAGLTPCPLDLTTSAGDLSRAIETADIRAIISQGRAGSERPADKLRYVAAGFFRLRFLLAYGPDVPEGVIDLDRTLVRPADHRDGKVSVVRSSELVTFPHDGGSASAIARRTSSSLIATAASVVAAARIRPGDRLVSLLAPDDLKGLATGLVAALCSGATLVAHASFASEMVHQSLSSTERTHLVAPGWMEWALAGEPSNTLASLILVHSAPVRSDPCPDLAIRTVDILALGEAALIPLVRRRSGRWAFADWSAQAPLPEPLLLEAKLSASEEIWLRGHAVLSDLQAVEDEEDSGWGSSGFRLAREGGAVVGVS